MILQKGTGRMILVVSIIFSAILGFLLLMMGPLVGGIIAFGIVVGCLFRGLSLLYELNEKADRIMRNQE